MLTVDLTALEREGEVRFRGGLPAEGEAWGDPPPRFVRDLEVEGVARRMPQGAVLVQADIRGTWLGECPRCLDEVSQEVDLSVSSYFSPEATEDDGEVRPLPEEVVELDLVPVLREEVLLALPSYVVCRPDCKGLCAKCGAQLNEGPCGCSDREIDPRWAALRPD